VIKKEVLVDKALDKVLVDQHLLLHGQVGLELDWQTFHPKKVSITILSMANLEHLLQRRKKNPQQEAELLSDQEPVMKELLLQKAQHHQVVLLSDQELVMKELLLLPAAVAVVDQLLLVAVVDQLLLLLVAVVDQLDQLEYLWLALVVDLHQLLRSNLILLD
jgi:hypothetical protein